MGAQTLRLDAVVPAEFRGGRADAVAAKLFAAAGAGVSRSEIAGWLKTGEMTVDGRRTKPSALLRGGERLAAGVRRLPRFDWQAAEPLDFAIVYEDDAVIVIDKPPGLVVHPGAGNARGTLVNGLLHRRPELATLPRAGLVHRLDKDTSGLMAVAGDARSQTRLIADLAARAVERRYLAVVEGRVISDRRIDLAIGRDPRNRLRQAVRADGRPAATRIAVRERFAAHSIVEAQLETGRTHQVRVHLSAIGHPLAGDRRYGARGLVPPAADAADAEAIRRFPRQALHAAHLAFAHPRSGEALAFDSAPAADIRALRAALRRGDGLE